MTRYFIMSFKLDGPGNCPSSAHREHLLVVQVTETIGSQGSDWPAKTLFDEQRRHTFVIPTTTDASDWEDAEVVECECSKPEQPTYWLKRTPRR